MAHLIARIAAALGSAVVMATAPVPGKAQSPAPGISDAGTRSLNMGVGKSVIIDLPQDAGEIFVGNPKVANAIVRSPRKLYVLAVDNGQTTIFAMDKEGRQITTLQISVGRDVDELERILHIALPRTRIVARTVGNTIILTGSVDSAGEAQQAVDIAKGFLNDTQAPLTGAESTSATTTTTTGGAPAATTTTTASPTSSAPSTTPVGGVINALTIKGKDQVMLKVSIVEIQRTVLKELGVNTSANWSTSSNCGIQPCNSFNMSNPLSLNGSAGVLNNTWAGKAGKFLEEQVQAFERYGVARVLAEPTVTAISGESAKFTAGGEIPVPSSETCTPTAIGGTTTNVCTVGIDFKQYGVTLNFTPVVLAEGRILLRVATEVTEIDPDRSFNFVTVTVNGFRTRKNETTVELPSGGSIVSAGLLQTNKRQVIAGLPGLMNLPILGALFRSRDYQRDETELMIVVTPYIARTLAPGEVARPDDGLADASDPQGWFLGRVNRLYSTTSNPQALQNYKGKVGFIND